MTDWFEHRLSSLPSNTDDTSNGKEPVSVSESSVPQIM